MREYWRDWQVKYYEEDAEGYRAIRRRMKDKNPIGFMVRGARSRAIRKAIPFTITDADVTIPENCPCCSVKMTPRRGPAGKGFLRESPSLDRIDSRLGYVVGNIAVICSRCNTLKNDASIEELETVLRWMKSVQHKWGQLALVA
jgi:hypothetical protein